MRSKSDEFVPDSRYHERKSLMKDSLHLETAKRLATLLDDRFQILGVRIGLDPVLDLIPGIGDVFATGVAAYIIYVAWSRKMPLGKIMRMVVNWFLDFLLGLLPIVGPIGTIFFRSNRMNIRILEEYLKNNTVEEGMIVNG